MKAKIAANKPIPSNKNASTEPMRPIIHWPFIS